MDRWSLTYKHVQRALGRRVRWLAPGGGRSDAPKAARNVDNRPLIAALHEREERLGDTHRPEYVRSKEAR